MQCGVHGEITLRTIDTMWHAMYVYGTFFAFATVPLIAPENNLKRISFLSTSAFETVNVTAQCTTFEFLKALVLKQID